MAEPLSRKRIVLGVSGSIAAYKAADIASRLVHLDADVTVILTPSAAEFIGAPTFRALTRNPVLESLFDEPTDGEIAHIALAQQSDLILVAPATANTIAKMAHGIADDLLSTMLLAATVPILLAPAMNAAMLDHPATQASLNTLRERGVELIDPAYGLLACRTEGWGKLAEITDIVSAVLARIRRSRDLEGVRVVVTAGPTHEPLDPVRYISNRSSGKMGYAIADAAARRGANVRLVSGPTALSAPSGVERIDVRSTEEMLEAALPAFVDCDLFISAAAPADFRPESPSTSKIKKSDGPPEIRLVETPDILRALAERKTRQVVVGFAAETDNLLEHGRAKIAAKKLDLLVANDVTLPGAGFEVDTNIVTLLWPDGRSESLDILPKRQVADRILDAANQILPRREAVS